MPFPERLLGDSRGVGAGQTQGSAALHLGLYTCRPARRGSNRNRFATQGLLPSFVGLPPWVDLLVSFSAHIARSLGSGLRESEVGLKHVEDSVLCCVVSRSFCLSFPRGMVFSFHYSFLSSFGDTMLLSFLQKLMFGTECSKS